MSQYGGFLDLLRDACMTTGQQTSQYPNWGRDKEKELLKAFQGNLATLGSKSGFSMSISDPYVPEGFVTSDDHQLFIDLVIEHASSRFAVEGKFKTKSDGAIPDNRIEAFYDLWKCETYVDSGEYEASFFIWFTDQPGYLRGASGKSREFSVHDGRIYEKCTPLHASRSRRDIPLPLTLKRDYKFKWTPLPLNWHLLSFQVTKKTSISLF